MPLTWALPSSTHCEHLSLLTKVHKLLPLLRPSSKGHLCVILRQVFSCFLLLAHPLRALPTNLLLTHHIRAPLHSISKTCLWTVRSPFSSHRQDTLILCPSFCCQVTQLYHMLATLPRCSSSSPTELPDPLHMIQLTFLAVVDFLTFSSLFF